MKLLGTLTLSAALLGLLLFGTACQTTEETPFQARAQMFDPDIPVDADYQDLSADAQEKAVRYEEGADVPDQPPYPLGGWQAVHDNLELPERPPHGKDEGEVYVEFVLGPNGRVEEAEILEGFSNEVDAAVLEAFLQTPFQPAVKDGIPMRVKLRNRVSIAYNDY